MAVAACPCQNSMDRSHLQHACCKYTNTYLPTCMHACMHECMHARIHSKKNAHNQCCRAHTAALPRISIAHHVHTLTPLLCVLPLLALQCLQHAHARTQAHIMRSHTHTPCWLARVVAQPCCPLYPPWRHLVPVLPKLPFLGLHGLQQAHTHTNAHTHMHLLTHTRAHSLSVSP